MKTRIELPRWLVCCWAAALHLAVGRDDMAALYITELMTMAPAAPWGNA